MKTIAKLLCGLCLFCMAACAGSSYNEATCQSLVEKIKSHDDLTESDLDGMIDQYGALVTWMADEKKAANGNNEIYEKALSSEEGKKKGEYLVYFALELQKNKDKLSAKNVAKLATLMNKVNELKK